MEGEEILLLAINVRVGQAFSCTKLKVELVKLRDSRVSWNPAEKTREVK